MLKKFIVRTFLFLLILFVVSVGVLFFAPTGSWLVVPLAQRFGSSVVPSLAVDNVEGSLSGGYVIEGVRIHSGDITFATLRRLVVRPDWGSTLSGAPWLHVLEAEGLSSDVGSLQTLADHYGGGEKSESSGAFVLRPLRLALRDIRVGTPEGPLVLESADLSPDGFFALRGTAGKQNFPLRMDGALALAPLEMLSCDIRVGVGRGSLKGRLDPPFNLIGTLSGLSLEDLLTFAPNVKGSGSIDGSFTLQGEGADLIADGELSLSRARVMDVPVEARLPWRYRDGLLVVPQARLRSLSADVFLAVSADVNAASAEKLVAKGYAHNISMKNLGRIFAPQAKLSGEGGHLEFQGVLTKGGALSAVLEARLPELSAQGKNLVKNFSANARLVPGQPPTLECAGTVLGGGVRGQGSFSQQGPDLSPEMVFTGTNLDMALLGSTFPALAAAAPSGKLSFTLRIDEDFSVSSTLKSEKLAASGVVAQNVTAYAVYFDNQLRLKDLKGQIGKAPFLFSGQADLKRSTLRFEGGISGLDPRSVPQIGGQVQGPLNAKVEVDGAFADPRVSVSITGQNNRVADIPLRNLKLAAVYAKNHLTLPQTVLSVLGGTLSFQGDVALGGELRLNLSGSTTGLNLQTLAQTLKLKQPLSGQVDAKFKVSGPLSTAEVTADLRSKALSFGETQVRDLYAEARGSMKSVSVRAFKARVNGGSIDGSGSLSLAAKDMMKNQANLKLAIKGIEVRHLLNQFAADAGVGGILNGSLALTGSLGRPELTLRVDSPLTIKETLVDRMVVSVQSPGKDRFVLHASGKVGDLKLSAKGEVKQEGKGWNYSFATDPLDLNGLVSAKSPSMKGKLDGQLLAKATGTTNPDKSGKLRPAAVVLSIPKLTASGLTVTDISLPLQITDKIAKLKGGKARLYKGTVDAEADFDLTAMKMTGTVKVRQVDMGAMAQPFMPEGAIVGSADVNVRLKGNFGALTMFFANGDFETSSGYLHKMKVIDLVSETKKLSFKNIRGTFFWDGKDLRLNPGTQATAEPNDPFYRYFSVNGAMGIPGKGLNLVCKGRFDIKLLDSFLGALKGVFQFFTGGLSGGGGMGVGILKGTVGKMLGIKSRDFQDVSFVLRGSWAELQLLSLKIDKPLQQYLPIDRLNKTEDQKLDEKKFRFNISIPTGPGDDSPDNKPEDQFKEQLLDNLFSIGD